MPSVEELLTENDSWWTCVHVQPERNPRNNNNEDGRNIIVHHEETHFSCELERNAYRAEITRCVTGNNVKYLNLAYRAMDSEMHSGIIYTQQIRRL